jgi:hypothetical protein
MVGLFVSLSAWAQPSGLIPRVFLPGEGIGWQFYASAPIVVAIRPNKSRWLGRPFAITPGGLEIRLVEVKAAVESSYAGNLEHGQITFYYYASTHASSNLEIIWFERNSPTIVFLRRDGTQLRLFSDVTCLRISLVGSEISVAAAGSPKDGDVLRRVAAVSLSPAKEQPEVFASSLREKIRVLRTIVGSSSIATKLLELQKNTDERIQWASCLALADYYPNTASCLRSSTTWTDDDYRASALRALRNRSPGKLLAEALRDNPLGLLRSMDPNDAYVDLHIYSMDSDADVRREACSAITRLFPTHEPDSCP